MPTRVLTLGTLRVHHDGEELERLPAQPVRCALLLYLAFEREVTRDAALGMLWPEHAPERARHALSQTVYELRQILGDDWVELRGDRLFVSDSVTVDLLDLIDALERGEPERALELYGGAFLGGTYPSTTRAFEGWVDGWQAKLARLHRRARREAIEARLEADDTKAALELTRAWVELDPLDDEAQHRLIELLATSGDRSAALRQYERYESLVRRQLELEPLDETKELVARIRGGPTEAARPAEEPPAMEAAAPDGSGATADRVREAAPAYATEPGATIEPSAARATPRTLREEIRSRHVVQWTVGYAAGAIAVLEGVDILFGWPEWLRPRLWLLMAIGLVMVLVAAWNHGETGIQRVRGPEILTQGILVALAALILFWRPAISDGFEAPLTEIAVMYLDDFSSESQQGLAAQMTEALIAELDWSEGVEVRPRLAVAPFRNKDTPLDSVARALRVGAIVEGSVHEVGDDIRLNIQLFDAVSHDHILTDTLHASRESREAILGVLPREAARSILTEIGKEVRRRDARGRTDSERAWLLYSQAARILEEDPSLRPALGGLERADSLLAEAERADPDWPDPTLKRAEVWGVRARDTAAPGENYEPTATRTAIRHLDRMLARHPEFAPALARRGALRVELAENQPADSAAILRTAAERDLRAAVDADPRNATAWRWLADLLQRRSQHRAAYQAARRALEVDAFLENELMLLFWYAFGAHDAQEHAEARRACALGRERYPTSSAFMQCTFYILGADPEIQPDPDRVWALRDTIMTRSAQPEVWKHLGKIFVAKTLARAGLPDSARAVLNPYLPPDPERKYTTYHHAHARVLLGDHDEAIRLLRAYVRNNPAKAPTLATDWYFEPLRDDPRFQELTGTLRHP